MLETESAGRSINDVDAVVAERDGSSRCARESRAQSMLLAPLVSGDEVRGRISLQNLDRTNAFTETDVRLLTTLAGSLSVALENARLVHETRQRNAELALINSVQDAIAGELDLQAIYDAVGDKIQEIFDAQVGDDRDARRGDRAYCDYPYIIERGERLAGRADAAGRLREARARDARAAARHREPRRRVGAVRQRGRRRRARRSRSCSSRSSPAARRRA